MSGPLRAGREAVILSVHAQPRARREELSGLHGDRLRVRTTAPPADGKANTRLVALLAKAFGLSRGEVELVTGSTSRQKEFALRGISLDEADRRLEAILDS